MKITTVAFQERTSDGQNWWVVVGLNKYLAAQGRTIKEAREGFSKVVAKMNQIATDRGEEPMARIGPAPRGLLQFAY